MGIPSGPRGAAPASVRRFAPLSGLRSAPRARQGPTPPANFKANREKLQDTQQKVRDTQPNPCYSAKNNVAIRTISTFMSTPLKHRTPYAMYKKARNNAEFECVKMKALLKDGLMKTPYVISIYSPQLLL